MPKSKCLSRETARPSFSCDDGGGMVDRRAVLAGLAGALAFAPAALANESRTKISDLADDDGVASSLARARAGQSASLRGYFAPGMRAGVLFDLFERPAAPCSMCGFFHDAGASISVLGENMPAGLNMLRAIDVTGTIAVDARGKAQLIAREISVV